MKIAKTIFTILAILLLCTNVVQASYFDDDKKEKFKEKYKEKFKEKIKEKYKEKEKKTFISAPKILVLELEDSKDNISLSNCVNIIEHIKENEFLIKYTKKKNYLINKNFFIQKENNKKLTKIKIKSLKELEQKSKLSKNIQEYEPPFWAKSPNGNIYLNIIFWDGITQFEKKDIRKFDIEILREIREFNTKIIEIPAQNIEKIAKLNYIKQIDYISPPKKEMLEIAKEHIGINNKYQKSQNYSGENIKIMTYDSGVPYEHPDISERLKIQNKLPFKNNHATKIAGILVGNGTLNNEIIGMAPKAELIAYQFEPWTFIDGMWDMYNNYKSGIEEFNVDLISNSWGSDFGQTCEYYNWYAGTYTQESYLIDSFIESNITKNQVPIVFSAGNYKDLCNKEYKTLTPQASSKNVITVGSINTNDNSLSFYSSTGPTEDGRIKPEIVAPGCHKDNFLFFKGISSTNKNLLFQKFNYKESCGTSISAPFVSGTIALMKEQLNKKNISIIPSTYKAIIINSANWINNTKPNFKTGFGLLNTTKSIQTLNEDKYFEGTIKNYQQKEHTLTINDNSHIKITLAWDDPVQESFFSEKELVNDIDLKLISPTNKEYYPWTLDPKDPTIEAKNTKKDNINNIEQIFVPKENFEKGNWTIEISTDNCKECPQKYSLSWDYIKENEKDKKYENLVAYYDFEGDFTDKTGNGYDLTSKNSVGFDKGIKGSAASFDGIDDYAILPDFDHILNYDKNWTISMWVYEDGVGGNTFFGSSDGGSRTKQFFIGNTTIKISSNADTNADWRIDYKLYISNSWKYLTLTWDKIGSLKLYINGELMASDYIGKLADYHPNRHNLILGAIFHGYENNIGYHFDGKIDEFKIFNKTLSDEEIKHLYNSVN